MNESNWSRRDWLKTSGSLGGLAMANALSPFPAASAAEASSAINIGSRRELFVDRLLIERMRGAALKMHSPVKTPRAKSPLPVRHMKTIIRDKGLLHAWYRGSDPSFTGEKHTGHAGETLHYARSVDGHEWEFPNLGLHTIGGTRDNNVILANQPPFLTNFMPFLDTRPGIPANERFKTLAGYPGPGDKRGTNIPGRGLFAFVSPDGISWTKRKEAIPFRSEWRHAFDSPNVTFWSEAEQLYVCYFRTWTRPERLRSISHSTSKDFVNWSKPVEMHPNLPGEHLYTNSTQPYPRAPHIYIALPTRFVPGRGDGPDYDRKDVNATDILFMTTRAGSEKYDRAFTHAFIRPGMDPASWKNRSNYAALNVIQSSPKELSIYHRSGERYDLRTDGFISINAGAKKAEVVTKPLIFSGKHLEVNLSASAVGGLRVELQTEDGKPIPGFSLKDCAPVYGDGIDLAVKWKDDANLAAIAGRPVRMRFAMTECDLYAFRFH